MEYGAIDLHKKESQIRIMTATGEVIDHRIPTTRECFTHVFWGRPRMPILVEASTESEWVAQHLEQLGHDVIVADPNYRPMYGHRSRRIKTDRRDVAALVVACQHGTYRLVHRRSARQHEVQCRLNVRQALTQSRTRAISLARGITRAAGLRLRSGTSETFLTRLAGLDLSPAMKTTLLPLRSVIEVLDDELAKADQQFQALVTADPVVKRLTTLPAIGPITASAFVAALDVVSRFDRARPSHQLPRPRPTGIQLGRETATRACPTQRASISAVIIGTSGLAHLAQRRSAHRAFPLLGAGHCAATWQEGGRRRARAASRPHALCHVAGPNGLSTGADPPAAGSRCDTTNGRRRHRGVGVIQRGRQAGGASARGELAARESRPIEGAAPPSDPPVRRHKTCHDRARIKG